MKLTVTPSGQACGATVTGVDLTCPLDDATGAASRAAWLDHHVLAFPGQPMSDDDLERFTLYFGPFGEDPFIAPIPGREHIIAVERAADEKAPIFADVWHTDWSFQKTPPAGTCLYGITIPPLGGDTLFSNQHRVYEALPANLRDRLEGKQAIHSARRGYGKDGLYGEGDAEDRSMRILSSDDAQATQLHPILRKHPETGRPGVFGCFGYIIGIDGMREDDANALLVELYGWQDREEFRYRHTWAPNELLMWDNRSVLHKSTGGYDGHARRLHRTTIGAR
jgi:taurine dioxygenase